MKSNFELKIHLMKITKFYFFKQKFLSSNQNISYELITNFYFLKLQVFVFKLKYSIRVTYDNNYILMFIC